MNLKVNTISICQIVHRALNMFPYVRLPVPLPILNREMEQKRFWLILPVITYCRGEEGWGIFEYHMVVRGVMGNKEGISKKGVL